MPQIHKLNKDLINKIAAGEVVERPASIIKELVENSIDAGATEITVILEEAGIQKIQIIDNGSGLSSDQFSLLFERHATSKISTLEDLENNLNLGFRGEALASIASVSKVVFQSFPQNQDSGCQIDHNGEITPVAMPHGTQITISDLFYNVPVRKKYLKNTSTEYKHCLNVLQDYAICHPEISFKLTHNNKQIFDYASTDRQQRLGQIYGEELSSNLLPVFYSGADLKIEGFIGKPEIAKSKKPEQHFLVNGRPIKTHTFNYAVKQAFGSLIFPQEKPQFFLWLELDPQDVDMNVHPRKIEARFHFEGIIFRKIIRSVKDALQKTDLTKTLKLHKSSAETFLPSQPTTQNAYRPQKQSISFPNQSFQIQKSKGSLMNYFQENHSQNRSSQTLEQTHQKPKLIPLVQIKNSYILCQNEDSIVIIDQHAAHERILYEKFKAEALALEPQSQSLLTPIQIKLTTQQVETLKQNEATFQKIGFSISDLGDNTVAVLAVPLKFSQNDLDEILQGLLNDIEENSTDNLSEIEDVVINYAACRGAIKFGQPLTKDEMIALIQEMEKIQHKQYSCPHGRPSKVEITFHDLEKQFKRVK